jgi:hypothetical protein
MSVIEDHHVLRAHIMPVWALHLSGADEQGPRDAVVVTVDCTKISWLLRLNGESDPPLCAATRSAAWQPALRPNGMICAVAHGRLRMTDIHTLRESGIRVIQGDLRYRGCRMRACSSWRGAASWFRWQLLLAAAEGLSCLCGVAGQELR